MWAISFSCGCHELIQKAISFNEVAIAYVKGSAYRIYFWYVRKNDAFSIMNNSNLVDTKGVLYWYIQTELVRWRNLLSKKQGSDTK